MQQEPRAVRGGAALWQIAIGARRFVLVLRFHLAGRILLVVILAIAWSRSVPRAIVVAGVQLGVSFAGITVCRKTMMACAFR